MFGGLGALRWLPPLFRGVIPLFYLSAQQPVDALKGLRNRFPRDLWLRKGLVVVQFAVSAILIASTLVVYQQMDLVRGKYLGFDRDQIVVVKIFGPDAEQIHLNGQYNAVKQRFSPASRYCRCGHESGFAWTQLAEPAFCVGC